MTASSWEQNVPITQQPLGHLPVIEILSLQQQFACYPQTRSAGSTRNLHTAVILSFHYPSLSALPLLSFHPPSLQANLCTFFLPHSAYFLSLFSHQPSHASFQSPNLLCVIQQTNLTHPSQEALNTGSVERRSYYWMEKCSRILKS